MGRVCERSPGNFPWTHDVISTVCTKHNDKKKNAEWGLNEFPSESLRYPINNTDQNPHQRFSKSVKITTENCFVLCTTCKGKSELGNFSFSV